MFGFVRHIGYGRKEILGFDVQGGVLQAAPPTTSIAVANHCLIKQKSVPGDTESTQQQAVCYPAVLEGY